MKNELRKEKMLIDGRRRYMTVSEVAEATGMGLSTVYDEIQRGNIRAKRFGKKSIRVHVDELKRYEEASDYLP